eukprot:gene2035-2357_t
MQQALQLQAQLVGWQRLHTCFMEDQYPAWATAVLTVVASDWLNAADGVDEASLQELHTLMADTFLLSPAHMALAALVG